MGVIKKAKAVEGIFKALDKEIAQFKASTGLKCLEGCGACCKKPDIEASILEFLPLAVHLYNSGKAEEILDLIESNEDNGTCVLFTPVIADGTAGFCSEYKHRGLICRLFGYSATKDKNGQLVLAICRRIKDALPEIYQKANSDINNGLPVPVISNYYSRLQSIDFGLSSRMMPINKAIKLAIESVALYFYYSNPKAV
jgi:uncharacterized protein